MEKNSDTHLNSKLSINIDLQPFLVTLRLNYSTHFQIGLNRKKRISEHLQSIHTREVLNSLSAHANHLLHPQ